MKVKNRMQFDKEICNLQKKMNKGQSNGVMLDIMTSKMIIDLNILSPFMKNRVVNNLNRVFVVTIHRSEMRKKLFIYTSNQTIYLVINAIIQ